MPPHALAARVCDADDGLTLEDILAKSDAIVRRTAAQWRLAALMEVEWLLLIADRIHRKPQDLGRALPSFLDGVRAIEDQAAVLGLSGARRSAAALCLYLSGIDGEGEHLDDPYRHIAAIEMSMILLQGELAVDAPDQDFSPEAVSEAA